MPALGMYFFNLSTWNVLDATCQCSGSSSVAVEAVTASTGNGPSNLQRKCLSPGVGVTSAER